MTLGVPRIAVVIIVHHLYHLFFTLAMALLASMRDLTNLSIRQQTGAVITRARTQLVCVALTHGPGLSHAKNKG
jgi:hypothetical protein